jgi:glycosyltransferase involved in cell wall biosynthesis
MRVSFITHYEALYGANRSLLNLIDGLRQYNVSSYVVSREEGEITKVLQDLGVPVAIMPMRRWMSRLPSECGALRRIPQHIVRRLYTLEALYRNFRLLPALVRQLRGWDIDIIYTNSSVIPIGALAAKWLRIPHVWHLREFGDLDYGFYPDWGRTIFRRVIGSADAVIAISKAVCSHVLSGITSGRVHIIYNGVAWQADFDRLHELVQAQSGRQQLYSFALVGRIDQNKGQETAIRALAIVVKHFPNTCLIIVGGGDTSKLKHVATELGVADNIEFWGFVRDPYTAYLAADAVLVCSKNEAMGRVTVEAMSACRPVIGYDSGGTGEIIEHEHTGILYLSGPEKLAEYMIQFIENPDWARQLGENGWQVARNKYSIEAYAENVYAVLRSIIT